MFYLNIEQILNKFMEEIAINIKQNKKIGCFLQQPQELVNFLMVILSEISSNDITFAEIGLLKGGSFVYIGNFLTRFFKKVHGIGIDLPGEEHSMGIPWDDENPINPAEEIITLNPKFSYKLFIGDSHSEEIIRCVYDYHKPIDVLFIDGDHRTEGCMADFTNYQPLVKRGGLIAFHDISNEDFNIVDCVWPQIKQKYKKSWEFVNCPGRFGIGVVKV